MNKSTTTKPIIIPTLKIDRKKRFRQVMRYKWLYVMLIPGIVYYLIFKFLPMFGLAAAFKDYQPFLGFNASEWVGMKHFIRFFSNTSFLRILGNTLTISLLNLVFYFPFPIIIALLLNDVRKKVFRETVQSILFIPHFLSWVIVTGIFYTLFTTDGGVVNNLMTNGFHMDSTNFLGSEFWFRPMVVFQNIWKEAGWGSIIYMAALSGIDIEMYEAARLDGASRLKQVWYITLPSIKTTIITMFILRLGNIMESGFDQIFLMSNAMNRNVSQVIDTYVYETGIQSGQLSYSSAVGLFQSLIGLILVLTADALAKKAGEEGIL